MRKPNKIGVLVLRHNHYYGEGAKTAKLSVLKGFSLAVNVLLRNLR